MYKNILFDLDGTLVKSEEGIFKSLRHGLKGHLETEPTDKDLLPFIGPPITDSLSNVYGFDEEKQRAIVSKYRERYNDTGLFEAELYEGIEEVLEELVKDYKLYVVTTKPEPSAKKVIDHFGLSSYFQGIYGPTLDGKYNDKSDLMAHALEDSSIDPKGSLMIGDRKYDMIAAKDNGLDRAGVLYGYGDEEELRKAGAQDIIKEPKDIVDYIKKQGK